jgi:DNA-binding GntR family transcriptional regulator
MREAMLRLDAEGLLVHVPQSGTRLRKPSPQETENLFDLRQLLEPYAAARAARMARPSEVRKLCRICSQMTQLIPRLVRGREKAWLGPVGSRLRVLDLQFHRTILGAAGNPSALVMFDRVGILPLLFQHYPDVMPTLAQDVLAADAEHQAIAEAIAAGDAQEARRRMETHLGRARQEVVSPPRKTEMEE